MNNLTLAEFDTNDLEEPFRPAREVYREELRLAAERQGEIETLAQFLETSYLLPFIRGAWISNQILADIKASGLFDSSADGTILLDEIKVKPFDPIQRLNEMIQRIVSLHFQSSPEEK